MDIPNIWNTPGLLNINWIKLFFSCCNSRDNQIIRSTRWDINDSRIVKPWSAKTRYPGRRFLKMPVSVLTKIYLIICFARCYTKAKSNLGKIFAQNCCQNLGNAILEILISKLFPGECPGIPYKCGPTRCLTKV